MQGKAGGEAADAALGPPGSNTLHKIEVNRPEPASSIIGSAYRLNGARYRVSLCASGNFKRINFIINFTGEQTMAQNKALTLALGTAFAATLAASPALRAADNPFEMESVKSGFQVADNKSKEGACGGDKAKEGACGGDKKKEGACGGDKKKEGACGGDKGK